MIMTMLMTMIIYHYHCHLFFHLPACHSPGQDLVQVCVQGWADPEEVDHVNDDHCDGGGDDHDNDESEWWFCKGWYQISEC